MSGEVQENPKRSELSLFTSENPDATLVLLFGWAGCNDRYLAKYSTIYEKSGFSVMRFTADILKVRSFSSYRTFALEIYENILESCTSPLIVCHLFSMNGCSVFCALWDLLDTVVNGDSLKARFKGVIFDSSPADVGAWQGATAISFATLPPPKYWGALRETYKMLLAGYFTVFYALIWLRSQWEKDVWEHNFAFHRMLAISDLPNNQLFIFSQADSICSAESIKEFIAIQKERGAAVTEICFVDSPHCQHYRVHQQQYEDSCLKFVRSLS